MTSHAALTAIGAYVPQRVLSNADLEQLVDTNDEWIVKMTGMKERRIAAEDEFTSHMCVAAVRDLQQRFAKPIDDVDLVIACTHTPDYPFPGVSNLVQHRLGLTNAGAFDLNATCAGFAYGLHVANGLISAGLHRKVLVIGADAMSKITDYTDRSTCILFGDGAGAALVERREEGGFRGAYVASDGEKGKHLYRLGLSDTIDGEPMAGGGKLVQNGREVYKWAVSAVPEGMSRLLEGAGMKPDDIDWFIPHSANMRIIESACEKSGFPLSRTLTSMAEYGNTSAATIPLSLARGVTNGSVKPGDMLLLYGFGGGLSQAALLVSWQP
ncbi:ketoacyl-ACP synthase III [Paenibacillus cymbidii]|uniref:ketoacyl-ACP synthase III n=1 Tax=Paenibacillus cymbidii TaxID=1639034 RepID=UPI001082024F|nr:ketoacyl-ACP synthase III [Paenibacillus cymbidii]